MGFPILVRWHLYIESGPRLQHSFFFFFQIVSATWYLHELETKSKKTFNETVLNEVSVFNSKGQLVLVKLACNEIIHISEVTSSSSNGISTDCCTTIRVLLEICSLGPLILYLTHWGRDEMAAILHTTFSNAFSWMKMFDFRLKCHWILFLMVQLTISQHWFR